MYNILFVLHETSATGAPAVALNHIRILSKRGFNCFFYTPHRGELFDYFTQYASFIETHNLPNCCKPDIIYLNTVETCAFWDLSFFTSIPIILHIHELAGTCHKTGIQCIQRVIDVSTLIICPSFAVKQSIDKLFVNVSAIHVLYPLDSFVFTSDPPRKLVAEQPLNILGVGEVSLGKGVDSFIDAAILLSRNPDIDFSWVGGNYRDLQYYLSLKYFQATGRECTVFKGYNKAPWANIYQNTLFVHPAREDSFPLVVLEAVSVGLPIMWNRNSNTGLHEYLDNTNSYSYQDDEPRSLCDAIILNWREPKELTSPISRINELAKTQVSIFDICKLLVK